MHLELTDWRRTVSELYAQVRLAADPQAGHERWVAGRDELFRAHPQSPLGADDPLRETGLPYWPYDPSLRFSVLLESPPADRSLTVPSSDGDIRMSLIGRLRLPIEDEPTVDAWWLDQYGGGLFLPLRDGTAGQGSYGGGRYLLDTTKGADLGGSFTELMLDLNFLYHPSCRYSPEWSCPLAPPGNRIAPAIRAGERLDW